MKIPFCMLSLSLCLLASSPHSHVSGRLVVQHRIGADPSAASRAFSQNGAALESANSRIHTSVIRVPEQRSDAVAAALMRTGLFTFVEPDFVAKTSMIPNDPSFTSQWHLSQIQASAGWDYTKGSTSVPIAIIDTGVDGTHPDLASKILPGWNFVTGTSNTSDVYGHGTAVAGTAAAASDNGIGVTGVAMLNPIMPLVVSDSTGAASYSAISNAITYAADHGVRVINISLAGTTASSTLQSAVDYAWSKNVVIVAGAGNSANTALNYPAACNHVIAVSATEPGDTLATFSSYGSWIELSAPGDNILTTTNGGGYGAWYGTSFASPITAGVAALAISLKPSLSNASVVSILEQNADDVGAPGFDDQFGYGRVNAYKVAVAVYSLGGDVIPPAVQISSPAASTTVSGMATVQGTASDNTAVSKVEFYVDGVLASTAPASPYSFPWATTNAANASHDLMVKAYDPAGNVGQSTVTVMVNNPVVSDIQPPSVAIMSPLPNSTVSSQTKITVNAVDNVGVRQVSVYIDGVQVYTGSVTPYTYTWNSRKAARGTHVISATAWDAAGNSTSAQVTVTK